MNYNLKELRMKAKISQKKLADALCVSQQVVSKWEAGDGFPRAEKLPEIAKILNCSIDELFATEDVKVG